MLSTVLRTIREQRLLESGDRVLVAVSGGADSMALLHVLWEARDRLGLATLEVATVDHGLRPEARGEAEQVAERARALGLPWHPLTVDVRGARGKRAASWQEAARRVRLAALDGLAERIGAGKIALGHQADDQAETVLFRILRGTGVRGLAGIPYRRERFIRPLLDVERRQIAAYLRRRSIPFVEDPSNADPRFSRARLRHQVIPALRAENPRLSEALRALATDAARLPPAAGGWPALGPRVAAVVDRLRRERGGTRRIDIKGGRVEIVYGQVALIAPGGPGASGPRAEADAAAPVVVVPGPGDYGWAGAASVAIRAGRPAAGAAGFDADLVAPPLTLRSIRPGDRMKPRGGRGSRKLSDLLIDAKIARDQRPRLPVLTTADGVILFVPGLRPAEFGRPGATTTRWLSVAWRSRPAG
jgi:tRNA(Ile)-lysidine synthase